jgi:adenylate kinase family enzyme
MSLEDTAFGNRLIIWAQSYYLTYRTNFEYKIFVQEEYWPELKFLNLPNTVALKKEDFYPKQKTYKISENHLRLIVFKNYTKDLRSHNYWYIDKWYLFDGEPEVSQLPNPYALIKFKNPSINGILSEYFKSFVSIHIRRYHCTSYTEDDLNEMPLDLREQYIKESYKPLLDQNSYYIKDEVYFKIIEKLLESDQNVKIYISTDLPEKFYKHYKIRYFKDTIKDKNDYYEKLKNVLKECFPESMIDKNKKIVENLLDFFVLAYSKFIIMHRYSTWSKITQKVKNTSFLKLPIDDNALNLLNFKM